MIQSTTKHRNTGERQNGIRDVIPKENNVHKNIYIFLFITGQTAPAGHGFAQGTEFVPNNYSLHAYNQ